MLNSCRVHTSRPPDDGICRQNKAEAQKTTSAERLLQAGVAYLAMETILVLDSSGTRGSLNSLLLRPGYDVRSVIGGVTLSALLASDRFSALFLGLQKETISTLATCLAIRQTDPDIPLIVLGSSTDIATKVGLFELGAGDYIEEPFDAVELVARLRSLIRRRKLSADSVHI